MKIEFLESKVFAGYTMNIGREALYGKESNLIQAKINLNVYLKTKIREIAKEYFEAGRIELLSENLSPKEKGWYMYKTIKDYEASKE